MSQRGKFLSLTMINWNGFFARTFDIDTLVTTLSGGNGAGKSTTMAAFITALIPDQSLLHFRNTTEAGSAASSRDKGLHGKLRPGICYAVIDVINSQQQRILFGVRLQQVAGRDKKVDIKPFVLQGVASSDNVTNLFVSQLANEQVKVKQLSEVKDSLRQQPAAQFTSLNSVTDYHALMFELGILPKKLRNTSDRAKYYRLIEASLYGGISSAITKSLRDYLLPQNGGVKKAFQDMEAALKENRATLAAIKLTQRDRDLFKHLIHESTQYVAADYMRHTNERRQTLTHTLKLRAQLTAEQAAFAALQQQSAQHVSAHTALVAKEQQLAEQQQQTVEQLQLMEMTAKQQQRIDAYQQEVDGLLLQLEEQAMVVEELAEQLQLAQEQAELSEEEVDSLKTQLADQQQALTMQQTKAVQYQQAVALLAKAAQTLGVSELQVEDLSMHTKALSEQEAECTKALLALQHQRDLSKAENGAFERGYQLVCALGGKVEKAQAGERAQSLLQQANTHRHQAQNVANLTLLHRDKKAQYQIQQQAHQLGLQYQKQYGVELKNDTELKHEQLRQQQLAVAIQQSLDIHQEDLRNISAVTEQITGQIAACQQRTPAWVAAKDALDSLVQQSEMPIGSRQDFIRVMQDMLAKERALFNDCDTLAQQKNTLEQEIEQLGQSGAGADLSLQALADSLGGTLLSDIYDDIALSDAPYFSALYGPARHAIVVPDLSEIKHKLITLEDCPEDVYLIEGDASGFDESVYRVEDLGDAVCVHLNERQLRFSRFPDVPLFGRAARDAHLETLRAQHDELQQLYADKAFSAQKVQRLNARFAQFVTLHLEVGFEPDPERELATLSHQLGQVQREQQCLQQQCVDAQAQLNATQNALTMLLSLSGIAAGLEAKVSSEEVDALQSELANAERSQAYLIKHQAALDELATLLSALQYCPQNLDLLDTRIREQDSHLQQIKTGLFVLAELHQRRQHFSYQDASTLSSENTELNSALKHKLQLAESVRQNSRDRLVQTRAQYSVKQQTLTELKTAYQAKFATMQEFQREIDLLGVACSAAELGKMQLQRDELAAQLAQLATEKTALEKALTLVEFELKNSLTSSKKQQKDYQAQRTLVVKSKANWVKVLKIARDSQVDKLLHRREMRYMAADALRSLSDKSLGALRLAVADNETLRDALRFSENAGHPERKVLFYVAMYQHLRERIRQDIIQTDDPIDAIEGMEIELARLTQELTQREKRLALSSESVASIIRKTILREQNRVRLLNQGLSNISFGQVNGVRLRISIRDSHVQLLSGLAEQASEHQDLFRHAELTFSEAMAKVFQRLNPHIDIGQRSLQIFGEELLDYRNYLELSIEVNRGTDGWLQAESGALSTGEAIGTGQAILLMVVQSWEEESRRLRAKHVLPCRLLFLDEAARLDSKSISTLFELCDRLDMQLLIAAPENISPEQGTTYKLIRKIFNNKEHVHVVGLRGFANKETISNTHIISV